MSNEYELVPANPPHDWFKHIVDRVTTHRELTPWKEITGIATAPLLLGDGSLIDQAGYNAATGVWFDPKGHIFPPIPAKPTKAQARTALDKFALVFGKYPFATTKENQPWDRRPSYAVVPATIISILIRHLLPTVPGLGVDAPVAGSGKTKLCEAVSAAATGCLPVTLSYDSMEEFDKTVPTPLNAGDQTILVDNLNKSFRSRRLNTAMTHRGIIDWRVLGETRNQKVLNSSVFLVTGNHLVIAGELRRRFLLCRLVPDVENPERRKFDFDPVEKALGMFPELAMAALTAVRWYLQADCPQPKYEDDMADAGSFTEWNRMVRGLLVQLGFGDPLATQDTLRDEDPWRQNDVALVRALYKDFGTGIFAAKDIKDKRGSSDAAVLLQEKDGSWDPQKVGFRLRSLRDRSLENLVIRFVRHEHGVVQYRIDDSRLSVTTAKKRKKF